MARFTLISAGLMMLVIGALHLVAPQMMMDAPKVQLTSTNHFHVIRTAYGGAYLGIAALFLLGLLRPTYERTSLIAVALLFCGFAVGRLYSIAVDGLPVPLYLAVLAFELVFATLALLALRKSA
jgi:hypothetical protein